MDHRYQHDPFIETWNFSCKVQFRKRGKKFPPNYSSVKRALERELLSRDVEESVSSDIEEAYPSRIIRSALDDLIADNLDGPECDYYITDYEEREGSLLITFGILVAVYHGISSYGSFRSGLDYLKRDIEKLCSSDDLTTRVSRRFGSRKELTQRERIEPTFIVDRRSPK